MNNLRGGGGGFTLIETLVVLGIIGLLVALSVPVLTRVQGHARAAVCLSNVRQLGIALNAYLVESEGTLPTLNNRADVAEPGPALDTLLPQPGLHRCPEDRDAIWETTGTSYFWNFTVNGQRIDALFSIAGGDQPTRVPLLSDKQGFHDVLNDKVNILYADGHAAYELKFLTPDDELIDGEGAP